MSNTYEEEKKDVYNLIVEKGKWDFLKATRFWAMVIGALSIYLKSKGLIGESEMLLIATVMGGFVAVKTIDKATEVK